MSEYKGRVSCPRCGPASGVNLADRDTYVSVTCRRCGWKFGELIPGAGPARNTQPGRRDVRKLRGMAFIAHRSLNDRAQKEFTHGFRWGLTAAAAPDGGDSAPDPEDWYEYGFNAALGHFPGDGTENHSKQEGSEIPEEHR